MAKIRVIEDDRTIAELLQEAVQHDGDEVCLSMPGKRAALCRSRTEPGVVAGPAALPLRACVRTAGRFRGALRARVLTGGIPQSQLGRSVRARVRRGRPDGGPLP